MSEIKQSILDKAKKAHEVFESRHGKVEFEVFNNIFLGGVYEGLDMAKGILKAQKTTSSELMRIAL